jgi:hypothetical protein
VTALPVSSSSLSVSVCPGSVFEYNGVDLSAGQTQSFALTNWQGCDSVVTVTVFEKPSSVEFREVKVCPGEAFVFQNQPLVAGDTRAFHLVNGEGCDSTVTISVSAWPELHLEWDTGISCPNAPTGTIAVSVLPGSPDPSGFSLNGSAFQPEPVFENVASGSAALTVRDVNGCDYVQTVTVPASPGLEVSLPNAFLIACDSGSVTLSPQISGDTTALRLLWWNGRRSPAVSIAEAGNVWVEVSNHCETVRKTASVAWADSEGDTLRIFVPNTFAPQAKLAENTLFRPFFGNNLTVLDYRLEVNDRWGNMVFLSKTPENGWEGRLAGSQSTQTAVYVWQLWARVFFCGREIDIYRKGDVTLIR